MTRVLCVLQALVLLLWPVSVLATGLTIGQTFQAVPLAAWAVVLVMSGVGGLLNILNSLKAELTQIDSLLTIENRLTMDPEAQLRRSEVQAVAMAHFYKRLPWMSLANMFSSMSAGSLVFFGIETYHINDFLEAGLIAMGAFGGAKTIDLLFTKFSDKAAKIVEAATS